MLGLKTNKMNNMIREFFEDHPIITTIVAILLLGLIFVFVDEIASQPKEMNGIVIDKHYEAEINRTGTGVGVSTGGNTAVVITSETEPEKFLLMVKNNSGQIVTVKCTPELYYQKEKGDKLTYNAYLGYFTKGVWSLKGVR